MVLTHCFTKIAISSPSLNYLFFVSLFVSLFLTSFKGELHPNQMHLRRMLKLYLETNRKTNTNYMQVRLMRLVSKSEYFIVPKGTKFTGSGK